MIGVVVVVVVMLYMIENSASDATRRRACGAFDADSQEDERLAAAALMRAHNVNHTGGAHNVNHTGGAFTRDRQNVHRFDLSERSRRDSQPCRRHRDTP